MRLVTWNCQGGPAANKLALVQRFEADIYVLSECPQLPPQDGTIWIGDEGKKGVGIIATRGLNVEPLPGFPMLPRYVIPVNVTGTRPFVLLAVWSKDEGADRYVRALHRAVELCETRVVLSDTVILGDFNSNAIWDREHPRHLNHTALVKRLAGLGLVSAYHAYFGQEHGKETLATFFLYRHQTRPYHIDYCFLPTRWTNALTSVEIGKFERWSISSDHVPLVIELDDRKLASAYNEI